MVEYELKKVYNCTQCGKEVVAIYNPKLEYVARDKCPQCKAKESKESVNKLLKNIFRDRDEFGNKSNNIQI